MPGTTAVLCGTLLDEIKHIPVIDTHEHLPPFESMREQPTDFLREYLIHYISSDLRSSGLSAVDLERATDITLPITERWAIVERYWEHCRYTGYGRALDISVEAIYGVDGIRRQTIQPLHEAFQHSLSPGHFRRVMKDMCGIRVALLNAFVDTHECDRDLFRSVWPPTNFILPQQSVGEMVYSLEDRFGLKVRTLDDWTHAFDLELDNRLSNGVVALKNILAYERSLRFEKVAYDTAKQHFFEAFRKWESTGRDPHCKLRFSRDLQDYMMHYVMRAASERGVTFQMHTGLFEGGGNYLSNSDPCLMENLFLEYPDLRFDLFHISYPFYGRAAALAKMFPNVYIDMCWAHIISPNASRAALSEFLDSVPYNKISAFGGDYGFVDGIYGHLTIARENVARVLAEKVEDGVFSTEKAVDVARALFHDNPIQIFGLRDLRQVTDQESTRRPGEVH